MLPHQYWLSYVNWYLPPCISFPTKTELYPRIFWNAPEGGNVFKAPKCRVANLEKLSVLVCFHGEAISFIPGATFCHQILSFPKKSRNSSLSANFVMADFSKTKGPSISTCKARTSINAVNMWVRCNMWDTSWYNCHLWKMFFLCVESWNKTKLYDHFQPSLRPFALPVKWTLWFCKMCLKFFMETAHHSTCGLYGPCNALAAF